MLKWLVDCLTHRGVGIIGGLLMAVGFFTSGFAEHIAHVYISYSLAGKHVISLYIHVTSSKCQYIFLVLSIDSLASVYIYRLPKNSNFKPSVRMFAPKFQSWWQVEDAATMHIYLCTLLCDELLRECDLTSTKISILT